MYETLFAQAGMNWATYGTIAATACTIVVIAGGMWHSVRYGNDTIYPLVVLGGSLFAVVTIAFMIVSYTIAKSETEAILVEQMQSELGFSDVALDLFSFDVAHETPFTAMRDGADISGAIIGAKDDKYFVVFGDSQ